MTIINCSFCGKSFNKVPSKIKAQNFCSNDCKFKNKNTKKLVECDKCGTKFYKRASLIAKQSNHYCSKACIKKNNHYLIDDNIAKIILNSPKYGEKICLIDKEDLNKILEFSTVKLKYERSNNSFYAVFQTWKNNKPSNIPLHRFIINAPKNLEVDHINHNTLDNRKSNLRLATKAENAQNKIKAQSNNKTSGIRGVSWKKDRQKWKAYLSVNRKQIHIGYFDDIKEAEIAIKKARATYHPFSPEALRCK